MTGSDSCHVFVFSPGQEKFLASRNLCVCDYCIDMDFELCSGFQVFDPVVQELSIKSTRCKVVAYDDNDNVPVATMITKGSIFAIRASNPVTNYFLVQCEAEVVEHNSDKPFVDDVGHVIYSGTKYENT